MKYYYRTTRDVKAAIGWKDAFTGLATGTPTEITLRAGVYVHTGSMKKLQAKLALLNAEYGAGYAIVER